MPETPESTQIPETVSPHSPITVPAPAETSIESGVSPERAEEFWGGIVGVVGLSPIPAPRPPEYEDGEVPEDPAKTVLAPFKRTSAQREADLEIVEFLTRKRRTQSEIAAHINVLRAPHYKISREQIKYDQQTLNKRLEQRIPVRLTVVKSAELANLEVQEKEAWEAWERSKGDEQRAVRMTDIPATGAQNAEAGGGRLINTKAKRDGDPRFLTILLNISKRRSEILGLDAPVKVEGEFTDKTPVDVDMLRKRFEERAVHRATQRGEVVLAPGRN